MLRPERKSRLTEFTPKTNWPVIVLLAGVFGIGLFLSTMPGYWATALYLFLWTVSYPVIYAGTCRYCNYYGSACPIPLEGSSVHLFVKKSNKPFGLTALVWATVAYGIRVAVPAGVIIEYGLVGAGIVYFGLLAMFWVVHLRVTGCPNCINTACPLNPGD